MSLRAGRRGRRARRRGRGVGARASAAPRIAPRSRTHLSHAARRGLLESPHRHNGVPATEDDEQRRSVRPALAGPGGRFRLLGAREAARHEGVRGLLGMHHPRALPVHREGDAAGLRRPRRRACTSSRATPAAPRACSSRPTTRTRSTPRRRATSRSSRRPVSTSSRRATAATRRSRRRTATSRPTGASASASTSASPARTCTTTASSSIMHFAEWLADDLGAGAHRVAR